MTILVTLTFQFVLPLEMSDCLDHLAYVFAKMKIKTFNPYCGSPPGVMMADTLSFNAKIGLDDF